MTTSDKTIHIVFRGVRGSHPMPGPTTLRFGGNTTSQEIRVGGRLLIFDAGTGIISLGNDLAKTGKAQNIALFFSHNHHDHTSGLLYFKPAYSPRNIIHIFGLGNDDGDDILEALERISSPNAHPVQLSRMGMQYTTNEVFSGDRVVWSPGGDAPKVIPADAKTNESDVVVRIYKNSLHPIGGVLNFRLEYGGKSYVFATDVEGDEKKGDPRLAEFARGADLLAHDGQYSSEEYGAIRKGWGHSTVAMAIRTAEMAGIRRLAIIHHDPNSDDDKLEQMEAEAQKTFPGVFFAHEGQEITV